MADISYPLINGRRYSYSSISSDFGQLQQLGIVEVNYTDSLEPGIAKGSSPQDLGTTVGDYKASGSVTFLRAEYDNYIAARAASSGTNSFMDQAEDVTISYSDLNQPVSTDELIGCRIKMNDHTNAQGSDPTKVKCDLYINLIVRNGILPFAAARR